MFGKKKETGDEITNRLKEAAEKGVNPKDVVGFSEIEENRNDSIKNSPNYIVVKDICMALAKSGYKLSLVDIKFDKRLSNFAAFYVYSNEGSNIGTIWLETNVKGMVVDQKEHSGMMNHLEKRNKVGQLCYQIQSFPFIGIISRIAPPQEPPGWLKICADVLKTYSPGVVDPEWVKQYPEAKKYINFMF
jgi:hypothetical protein